MNNISKIGIAVVVATLGAYAVASLERQHALSEEENRVTVMQNAEPWGDAEGIRRRVEWEIGRKNAAHDEWRKAIGTGTPADVASANRYGERIDEEIMEQKKAWAAQDEKNRDRREAAKREQHTDALAAIERKYYTHFALIWLAIVGVLLALSGWVAGLAPKAAASAPTGPNSEKGANHSLGEGSYPENIN